MKSGLSGLETRNEGTGSLGHGTWVVAQGKMTEEVGTGEQNAGVVLLRSHTTEGKLRMLRKAVCTHVTEACDYVRRDLHSQP